MKYLINVTKTDIKKGTPLRSRDCALARAVRRHRLLYDADVQVGASTISWDGIGNFVFLPEQAEFFRSQFDLKKPVQPFQFVLTIPDEMYESLRQAAVAKHGKA